MVYHHFFLADCHTGMQCTRFGQLIVRKCVYYYYYYYYYFSLAEASTLLLLLLLLLLLPSVGIPDGGKKLMIKERKVSIL